MTPARRQICKPLIRKNFPTFAKKCVQNTTTRKAMVKTMGRILNKEVARMCSNKFNSVLKSKTKESLEKFEIDIVIKELACQAPTLLSLLKSCLKTKTLRSNSSLLMVMITGMICKHRSSSCSLLQRMTSLILYAGHSAKQVS